MKTCLIVAGVVFALLIVIAVGVGIWIANWISTYQMPHTVVTGDALSPAVVEVIAEKIKLRPGETIQFFYSMGLPPQVLGNVITNQRVVYYEEGTEIEEADFTDIVRASGDSSLSFDLRNGETVYLTLADDREANLPAIRYLATHGQVGMAEGSKKVPGEHILTEEDLTPQGRQAIDAIAELAPQEKIIFFQPSGFWTFGDRGYLITDQRVVDYETEEEGLFVGEARLDEVAVVRADRNLLYFNDSQGETMLILGEGEPVTRRLIFEYLQGKGIKIDIHPADAPEGFELAPIDEPLEEEGSSGDTSADDSNGAESPADEAIEEPALP